jgi:hypothetical protein
MNNGNLLPCLVMFLSDVLFNRRLEQNISAFCVFGLFAAHRPDNSGFQTVCTD